MPLMMAQIQFIDAQLSLIHIPLKLYSHFLSPILELISLNIAGLNSHGNGNGNGATKPPDFINISVTPVECSIVCSKESADALFKPMLEALEKDLAKEISFGVEDYVVVQVDGDGLETYLNAGQRVIELTSPLAYAGM
jgi:hypothetical protein